MSVLHCSLPISQCPILAASLLVKMFVEWRKMLQSHQTPIFTLYFLVFLSSFSWMFSWPPLTLANWWNGTLDTRAKVKISKGLLFSIFLILFYFIFIFILLGRGKFCAKVPGSRGWNCWSLVGSCNVTLAGQRSRPHGPVLLPLLCQSTQQTVTLVRGWRAKLLTKLGGELQSGSLSPALVGSLGTGTVRPWETSGVSKNFSAFLIHSLTIPKEPPLFQFNGKLWAA